jgi:hypothetical protein
LKRFKNISIAIVAVLLLSDLISCSSSYPISGETQYTNPGWAPPYYSGVRYYYLPDIQAYYDLSNQDFAYLDNGQWLFSNSLPPMYSNYNLYTGFCVSLNTGVYQPWLHHQNYAYNYPRYYYRNKYQGTQYTAVRGFNENSRQPVFTTAEDQRRNNEARPSEINNQNNIDRKPIITRPPQNPSYRGKNIGQPVKVTPEMRQPKTDKRSENKNNGKGNNNRHG